MILDQLAAEAQKGKPTLDDKQCRNCLCAWPHTTAWVVPERCEHGLATPDQPPPVPCPKFDELPF